MNSGQTVSCNDVRGFFAKSVDGTVTVPKREKMTYHQPQSQMNYKYAHSGNSICIMLQADEEHQIGCNSQEGQDNCKQQNTWQNVGMLLKRDIDNVLHIAEIIIYVNECTLVISPQAVTTGISSLQRVFTSGSEGLDLPPYVFIMQNDGNAVVYGATAPIWSTDNGINQALVGWSKKWIIWKWKAENIENTCPSDMKNCHSIMYLAPVVNFTMLSMVCDSV